MGGLLVDGDKHVGALNSARELDSDANQRGFASFSRCLRLLGHWEAVNVVALIEDVATKVGRFPKQLR
jgi:hypothetical protein